jgi:uncharacterized protein DUF4350
VTTVPFGAEPVDVRTAPERWRAIPVGWRLLVAGVGLLVAIELGSSLVTGIAGNAPAGDSASSSFGTGPSGVAAMAQLLAARGHEVIKDSRPLSAQSLSPGSTLFVIDASSWTAADSASVARLLRGGGRVVVAGRPPAEGLLPAMFGPGGGPRWMSQSSGTARPVGSGPLTVGVSSVSSGPVGALVAGSASPVLAGPRGVLAASSGGGNPAAVLVASSTPFTNAALAGRDNAAFAINVAGPSSGPVVFDEYDHGYGHTGSGLAGLPSWWRWGLGVALLAVVIWMLSASRRFGPVERAERLLIPPRVAYVDAMATGLGSIGSDRLEATFTPLRQEGRRLLCRRAGVRVDAPDEDVAAAARQAMLPDEVIDGVLVEPRSSSDAVAAGRALAWLESRRGGTT